MGREYFDEETGRVYFDEGSEPTVPRPEPTESGTVPSVLQSITENPVLNPLGPVGRAYQQLTQGSEPPSAGGLMGLLASAALPMGLGIAGRRTLAAHPYLGETIGGMVGQAGNWLTGINPTPESPGQAIGELALQALPGPAARTSSKLSTVGPWVQRELNTLDPALGAGLAREAYERPIQGVMHIRPANRTVAKAFESLRENPEYRAMGTPVTTPSHLTYPGTDTPVLTPSGKTIATTTTTTPYPIQFPAALKITSEQARRFGEQRQLSPGLANSYTARITQLSKEGGTFENAHQLLRDLANDIRNPGTATPEEIRTLKQFRSAVWEDLDTHALTPELKKANHLAARQMGADELLGAIQKSRRQQGHIRVIPDVGTVIKKMEDIYLDEDNPFIRNAITPDEFRSLTDDLKNLHIEQLIARSNEGSLAAYGLAAGAGGGLGASIADVVGAPKGAGGLLGSIGGLLELKGTKEGMKRKAFEKPAQARRSAVKTFRTPAGPAWKPETAALPAHVGTQTIAEMFLRNRQIDPNTLQPVDEQEILRLE